MSEKKRRRLLSRDFELYLTVNLGVPLLYWVLRALKATWRITRVNGDLSLTKPCILAVYHTDLVVAATELPRIVPNVDVLVSKSRDGEISNKFISMFRGANVIRGGSSKGAEAALLQMIRGLEAGNAVVLPVDGPRGPAGIVKAGLITAASQTGAPIVPGAAIVDKSWNLRSWDRMAVPKPWTNVKIAHAPLYYVPKGISREEQEVHRLEVQRILDELRGGRFPARAQK